MNVHADTKMLEWIAGGDTGLSSKCIWRHMMGLSEPDDWVRANASPHDMDDFGRCYRLLLLSPIWRARIGEMGSHGALWAAIAARWDELEAMYLAGEKFPRELHCNSELMAAQS